ncbi:MAG: hypothetical protein ACRD21_05910, partial [Vicinamibacteria bacterium]
GEIVGVSPDGDAIRVRVPSSDGLASERTFYVDELTRIRNAGRPIPIDTLPTGGSVVVTYSRNDGRSIARIVDLSGNALAQSPVGERIDEPEDQARYEESVRSTLEILEEEIEELGGASETRGVTDLARKRALTGDLRTKHADTRDAYETLIAARSDVSWEVARRELQTRMSVLSDALARARSEITGR